MEFLTKTGLIFAATIVFTYVGCQKYDNPYDPLNADEDYDGDGVLNKDDVDPKDPSIGAAAADGGETTSGEVSSYAFSYSHKEITDFEDIDSAIYQDNKVYFSGSMVGSSSSYKIGVIDSSGGVTAYGPANFTVASGLSALRNSTRFKISEGGEENEIYLNYYLVETDSWHVSKELATTCLSTYFTNAALVCSRTDGRLHKYLYSQEYECGAEDGEQIGSASDVKSSYGDNVALVPSSGVSSCGASDSTLVVSDSLLTVYNKSNDMSVRYSLSTYPFTAVAAFSVDNTYVFIGCDQDISKCYKSVATVVTQ